MDRLLKWLMTQPPEAEGIASLEDWWARHRGLASAFHASIALAVAGGFVADRLGYAFASGYQAAGAHIFGAEPRPLALCATENGSAHPRDIQTTLRRDGDGWRLVGAKSFVTLGSFAERLVIVASVGVADDGRNRLRLVGVDARDGLVVTPLPEGPFVPEIPHASVTFDGVRVADDEIFEGDGYTRYLKPFRTVEDVHVHGALCGWLLSLSRRHWPHEVTEALLASIAAIHALADVDPASSAGHIALGGAMGRVRSILDEIDTLWASVDVATRERWERDRALLKVAGRARDQRLKSAWRDVAQTSTSQTSGA